MQCPEKMSQNGQNFSTNNPAFFCHDIFSWQHIYEEIKYNVDNVRLDARLEHGKQSDGIISCSTMWCPQKEHYALRWWLMTSPHPARHHISPHIKIYLQLITYYLLVQLAARDLAGLLAGPAGAGLADQQDGQPGLNGQLWSSQHRRGRHLPVLLQHGGEEG